jgi:CRP-like cAMP-binding protein
MTAGTVERRIAHRSTPREEAFMTEDAIESAELRTIPFFEAFSDEELDRLLTHSRLVRFGSGEPVLERGERASSFYVVLGGKARVEVGGRHHDLTRGDLLGEMAVLSSKPRMASVTAAEDLEAVEIDCGDDVDGFLKEHPAVAVGMLKIQTARLREVEDRLDAWMGVHRS